RNHCSLRLVRRVLINRPTTSAFGHTDAEPTSPKDRVWTRFGRWLSNGHSADGYKNSGWARAGINDRPDVLATQCRSEPAGNQSVHDLHALDVPRVRHDLEERAIERQRALEVCKVGGARLPEQLRLFRVGTMGISGVHPVHILHDREAGSSQRVS